MKTLNKLYIAFLMLIIAGNAHSALVNFNLTGEIDSATVGNPFGLTDTDTISAFAVFDDSLIASGLVDFSDPSIAMTITVGSETYTDAEEFLGGASLYFSGGAFNGLDYSATDLTFDSFNFSFVSTGQLAGTWTTATISPVPVPAAAWLFGSGLLGLVGLARRKAA